MRRFLLALLVVTGLLGAIVETHAQTLGEVIRAVQRRNLLSQESEFDDPVLNIQWGNGLGAMPDDSAVDGLPLETQMILLRQAWRESWSISGAFYEERFMRGDDIRTERFDFEKLQGRINPENFHYLLRLLAYRLSHMRTVWWDSRVTGLSYGFGCLWSDYGANSGSDPTPPLLAAQMSESSSPHPPSETTYPTVFFSIYGATGMTSYPGVNRGIVLPGLTAHGSTKCDGRVIFASNFDYFTVNTTDGWPEIYENAGQHPFGDAEVPKDGTSAMSTPSILGGGELNGLAFLGYWEPILNEDDHITVLGKKWRPSDKNQGSQDFLNEVVNQTTTLNTAVYFEGAFGSAGAEFTSLPEREVEEAPPLKPEQTLYRNRLRIRLANAPANECWLEWGNSTDPSMHSGLLPKGGGNWDAVFSGKSEDREEQILWPASATSAHGMYDSYVFYVNDWWRPVLRQLVCETYGLDIEQGPMNYTIKFYRRDQVGEKDSEGIYSFSGSPVEVWTVSSPQEDELQIQTSKGSYTWKRGDSFSKLSLVDGGSTLLEQTRTDGDNGFIDETKIDGKSIPKVTVKFLLGELFSLGSISEVKEEGASGTVTTSLSYADATEDGKTFKRLASITQTGGVAPFTANFSSAEQITSYSRTGGFESFTQSYSGKNVIRAERFNGSTVRTITTVYSSDLLNTTSTINGASDATSRIVERYTNVAAPGLPRGALKTTRDFDGSLATYTYSSEGQSLVVTERAGRGAGASATSVTNGTQTKTKINKAGKVYSTEVTDIESGALLDKAIAVNSGEMWPGAFTRMFGRTESFEYDGNGRITSHTDVLGKLATYTRDALGRVTQVSRAGDPAYNIQYNPFSAVGRFGTRTTAGGRTWEDEFDPQGTYQRSESIGGPDPVKSETTESASTRTTTVTGSAGTRSAVTTVQKNNLATQVSGNAVQATGGSDLWNITYATAPGGGMVRTATNTAIAALTGSETYDTIGRLTKTVSPSGNGGTITRTLAYAGGLLKSVTDPLATTSYEYASNGRLTKVIRGDRFLDISNSGSNASTIQRTYTTADGEEILKTSYAPATGAITKRPWGSAALAVTSTPSFSNDEINFSITGPNLSQTVKIKDGVLKSGTDNSAGMVGSFSATLNSFGDWTQVNISNGPNSFEKNFTAAGYLSSVKLNNSTIASYTSGFEQGGEFQISGTVDSRDKNIRLHPDGAVMNTTGSYGEADVQWTRQSAALLQSLTTGAGTMQFTWNAGGTLKNRKFLDGRTESYTYNVLGQLTGVTTPKGTINMTVNAFGQTTSITTTNINIFLGYDRAGRVTSALDDAGSHSIGYTQGRRTSETHASAGLMDGESVVRLFDSTGRLTTVTMGDMWYALSYGTYDHPTGVTTIGGKVGTWSSVDQRTGRMTKLVIGPLTVERTYDEQGRLTSCINTVISGGVPSVVAHCTPTYVNGNCTQYVSHHGAWVLSYDAYGNLSGATRAEDGSSFAHSWDEAQRNTLLGGITDYYPPKRLNQQKVRVLGSVDPGATVTINTVPTLVTSGKFAQIYPTSTGWQTIDVIGTKSGTPNKVAKKSFLVYVAPAQEGLTYDLNGNRATDARWTYTWDNLDRLKTMVETAPAVGVPAVKLEFVYDAFGRRAKKKIYSGSALKKLVSFLYEGDLLVKEVHSTAGGEELLRREYTWGPDVSGAYAGAAGIGGLIEVSEKIKGGVRKNYLALNDGLGNVMGLVDAATGAKVADYDHGPFGEVVGLSGTKIASSPLRWQSKYYDEETGLYYWGARYYDPKTRTWLSRDPLREDGGANHYAYCNNRPYQEVDPVGMDSYFLMGSFVADPKTFVQRENERAEGMKTSAPVMLPVVVGVAAAPAVAGVAGAIGLGELGTALVTGAGTAAVADASGQGAEIALDPAKKYDFGRTAFVSTAGAGLGYVGLQVGKAVYAFRSAYGAASETPVSALVVPVAETLPEGSFSVIDWTGYPAHLPKPTGPMTLLPSGSQELLVAQRAKAVINNELREAFGLRGLTNDIHEIQPVKFGGSPTDLSNKILIPRDLHQRVVTPFWNQLQRDLEPFVYPPPET
jgi:RHS repeat-associated protein